MRRSLRPRKKSAISGCWASFVSPRPVMSQGHCVWMSNGMLALSRLNLSWRLSLYQENKGHTAQSSLMNAGRVCTPSCSQSSRIARNLCMDESPAVL